LLGVWDQSGKLEENQCFVTYRLSNDVVQLMGKVVVMKNPTVHLGGEYFINQLYKSSGTPL